MDYTQIVLALLGVACAVLGWFARQVWAAVSELKKDLSTLQIMIGTDYVRYDRLKDAMEPIRTALHEIKTTLAGKADK
jgi:hypothetical protein